MGRHELVAPPPPAQEEPQQEESQQEESLQETLGTLRHLATRG
jgi:hypothetical protein